MLLVYLGLKHLSVCTSALCCCWLGSVLLTAPGAPAAGCCGLGGLFSAVGCACRVWHPARASSVQGASGDDELGLRITSRTGRNTTAQHSNTLGKTSIWSGLRRC